MKNSIFSFIKVYRRFQSTGNLTSVSSSLDLDFVLNLLDHHKGASTTNTNTIANNNSSHWTPFMKYKVVQNREKEKDKIEFKVVEDDLKQQMFATESKEIKKVTNDSNDFELNSGETLIRLQSLADSLPTKIFDRNGNLIPLNTSHPPMNFFDWDSSTSTSIPNLPQTTTTLPIFKRDNVDWSKVTLTSILKKIVPEEVFETSLKLEENSLVDSKTIETDSQEATSPLEIVQEFTSSELKLLDKDQLQTLAKHLHISCHQTDYRIELAILNSKNSQKSQKSQKSTPKDPKMTKNSVSKEKISWTEEHENLLMKLYEELRLEKSKVDQKLQSIMHQNNPSSPVRNAPSLRRGNGASERGLWAVLSERMRNLSKFHASVTECRNKVIILKRLKA